MARVVLDPVAEAHLLEHLEVVFRAHFQALRLEQAALRFQLDDPVLELVPNGGKRPVQFVGWGDELLRRKESDHAQLLARLAGEGIETRDRVDLVAKKLQPDRLLVGGRGINLDHVAAHPEFSAGKLDVVSPIEHVD